MAHRATSGATWQRSVRGMPEGAEATCEETMISCTRDVGSLRPDNPQSRAGPRKFWSEHVTVHRRADVLGSGRAQPHMADASGIYALDALRSDCVLITQTITAWRV